MDKNLITIALEDALHARFAVKMPVSFERGEGVYVFDENGRRYLDFSSGWGATSIGHAHPVITSALAEQAKKIMQNPNSGASYSPARARLLELMREILPAHLARVFFTNSGAEANDAAIKLARKASGKKKVISTLMSFHGRTISTASATGQDSHRGRFNPLMPYYVFVPYNDTGAVSSAIDEDTAAVIVEPVQGEGGVIVPSDGYLEEVSAICRARGVYLILDEIQTGFYRTGPVFASPPGVEADFLTMSKGIAGGFPIGAFAMTQAVMDLLVAGDHGGTFVGNPLGCAVAYAVIRHMRENGIEDNVGRMGSLAMEMVRAWQREFPGAIRDVRGKGLLLAIELADEERTAELSTECLKQGLVINVIQKKVVRILPALNITEKEMREGLGILHNAMRRVLA